MCIVQASENNICHYMPCDSQETWAVIRKFLMDLCTTAHVTLMHGTWCGVCFYMLCGISYWQNLNCFLKFTFALHLCLRCISLLELQSLGRTRGLFKFPVHTLCKHLVTHTSSTLTSVSILLAALPAKEVAGAGQLTSIRLPLVCPGDGMCFPGALEPRAPRHVFTRLPIAFIMHLAAVVHGIDGSSATPQTTVVSVLSNSKFCPEEASTGPGVGQS